MYLHLELNERFREDFGFCLRDKQGRKHYFRFTRMPFGYALATVVMDKLLRPVEHFLHKNSIDSSWFIDDQIGIQPTFIQSALALDFIKFLLGACGWEVNLEKSSIRPQKQITYLGFILDSTRMTVTAPEAKISYSTQLINELFVTQKQQGRVTNKALAKILGLVCHLLTSHGEVLRICTRASQHSLGLSVQEQGWHGFLRVSEQMREELDLCKIYLSK